MNPPQPRRVSGVILFSELRVAQLRSWLSWWGIVYLQHIYWRRMKFLDFLLFYFFFSLFVGLSANIIIHSHFFWEKPLPIILKAYCSGVQVISKQPGLDYWSEQISSLLHPGANISLWATLGMCLGGLAGSFQPWKCLRQPTLCSIFPWHIAVFYHANLRLDPTGGWFSALKLCSCYCEFINLAWNLLIRAALK